MESVLIYKDNQRIAREKTFLNVTVEFFQIVYNEFKAIEIPMTISELANCINQTVVRRLAKDQQKAIVEGIVKSKLVAAAGEQSFGGIKLNAQKVSDMIDIPNVDPIVVALDEFHRYSDNTLNFRIDLLVMTADVISKKVDSDSVIDTLFTHMTRNDKGAEIAAQLFALSSQLNDWQEYQPDKKINADYNGAVIRGIEFKNNNYLPSLDYIRQQESMYNTYVAS